MYKSYMCLSLSDVCQKCVDAVINEYKQEKGTAKVIVVMVALSNLARKCEELIETLPEKEKNRIERGMAISIVQTDSTKLLAPKFTYSQVTVQTPSGNTLREIQEATSTPEMDLINSLLDQLAARKGGKR
eukprot:TRINITY_DN17816_c0_g1_i1.p1 TRINITY_DN17816_c0_g1~~TRINITY_DN17816_c0_g1_i1.p1  ORF type:complete len:130 (+),score=16.97 TRINITY_DN17816_c0_g1_i1:460-849(+)